MGVEAFQRCGYRSASASLQWASAAISFHFLRCFWASTANTGIGYDDGVYLGAATRLVHGVLPSGILIRSATRNYLVTGPVALAGR